MNIHERFVMCIVFKTLSRLFLTIIDKYVAPQQGITKLIDFFQQAATCTTEDLGNPQMKVYFTS